MLGGRIDAAGFRSWLHHHLGLFLWQLEEHHGVEDHHYFPLFRRAEPRLARGFAMLVRDHDALQRVLEDLATRAGPVLQRAPSDPASSGERLGRLADVQAALGRELLRHLDDEEDLVLPLILEQGERTLFART